MKDEHLKLTPQKYKGSLKNTMNNDMPTNWTSERNRFLETYKLSRLNQEETENLDRLITSNKIESVSKHLTTKKSPRPDSFTDEF